MATLDAKLARGHARQVARRWDAIGRGVRGCNFRFAQSLVDEATRRGKVSPAQFNVPWAARIRHAENAPSTALLAGWRSGISTARGGRIYASSLVRRPVTHIRGTGGGFTSQDWTLACDDVSLERQRPSFHFSTMPLLVDQHLLERWVERTGESGAEGLPRSLGLAVPMAGLWLGAAGGEREVLLDHIDVVIPAPGGAFLGGTEVVEAGELHDGVYCLPGKGRTVSRLGLIDSPSRYVMIVSLRTYMDAALLSERQRDLLAEMTAWRTSNRQRLWRDGGLPFGLGAGDTSLVEEFLPLARAAQGEFSTWRRLLDEQGYSALDIDKVWRSGLREPDGGFGDLGVLARVARMACIGEGEVTLHLGAEDIAAAQSPEDPSPQRPR